MGAPRWCGASAGVCAFTAHHDTSAAAWRGSAALNAREAPAVLDATGSFRDTARMVGTQFLLGLGLGMALGLALAAMGQQQSMSAIERALESGRFRLSDGTGTVLSPRDSVERLKSLGPGGTVAQQKRLKGLAVAGALLAFAVGLVVAFFVARQVH
jgi:hypothetical protein